MAENETTRDDDGLLTGDERRDLGCQCVRLGSEWHHVYSCPVPTVERILAARLAAPDHRADNELRARVERLEELTEGVDRVGTAHWPEHDRNIYSLAIEEAKRALLGPRR